MARGAGGRSDLGATRGAEGVFCLSYNFFTPHTPGISVVTKKIYIKNLLCYNYEQKVLIFSAKIEVHLKKKKLFFSLFLKF